VNRIARAFAQAKAEQRAALIAYVCAGDPSLESTAAVVPLLAKAGADLIELGIPFSDPIADGPTIQAASHRALLRGTTPAKVLQLVGSLRQGGLEAPLLLMTYLNPILSYGLQDFCRRGAELGVDGILVPDLPLDEEGPVKQAASQHQMDLVLFAGPNTDPARLARIGRETRGFLYFLSLTGVTGARGVLPAELPEQLSAARAASAAPVAVGFGISTAEQARTLAGHADAVVVGSALVSKLHESNGDPRPALVLLQQLSAALRARSG
jgi:tryptophan synthase alpha chain